MLYRVTNGERSRSLESPSAIQAACEALHGIPLDNLEKFTTVYEQNDRQPCLSVETRLLASGAQPYHDLLRRLK